MALSSEDTFRLNVLLANTVKAIRINESTMVVHALTDAGEAKVPLNPNCPDHRYLRSVRELLSGHSMGSPGGYPVYLKRWTRMGQSRAENLEQLLLLGESEALIAVVCSPDLSSDIAERAWWVEPISEHARHMLGAKGVVEGKMGKVLANHLAEHLAFESDPQIMIDTVRLMLQPGLIEQTVKRHIWQKAKQKNTYVVGFLKSIPFDLPELLPAHPRYDHYQEILKPLCAADNSYAKMCVQLLSSSGQTFLTAGETVLKRPTNQDVVNELLDTIRDVFSPFQPSEYNKDTEGDLDQIIANVEQQMLQPDTARLDVLDKVPELRPMLKSMMVYSRLGYSVLRPIFSNTSAIGTLMRKKLKPVTDILFAQLQTLRSPIP